jgi:hypothetical protein
MNVEIEAEAALFPEKEYINGIFVAVWILVKIRGYVYSFCCKLNPWNCIYKYIAGFVCLLFVLFVQKRNGRIKGIC